MPRYEHFRLPDAGEGLTDAEIVAWRVAVGDLVEINQTIVEIETAKSLVELPSPFAGRVTALLVEAGTTVDVGTPIITVDTDPDGAAEPSDDSATAGRPSRPQPAEAGAEAIGEHDGGSASGAVLVGYGVTGHSATRRPRRGAGSGTSAAAEVTDAPSASSAS
ncbi:MAG: Dihydrolipoyllysine-residue acetyltransferase, partial [Actinotalea sp.]|nr:Dihydrolipoyllysine-residue acetyltransferase [Actinotalea sp.]